MDRNFENLANAIILRAVDDYRRVLRVLSKYPHNRLAQGECREIEQFFRSGWFGVLTQINPEKLMLQLKAEVAV